MNMKKTTLGIATAIVLFLVLPAAFSSGAPAVGGASWVSKPGVVLPEGPDGLMLSYTAVLSEAYTRVAAPESAVRLLALSVNVKTSEIVLQHVMHTPMVALSSSEPATLLMGEVNLSNVFTFAQTALGQLENIPAPVYSAQYEMTFSPATGLTWGDVTTADQIVVAVQVKSAPRER